MFVAVIFPLADLRGLHDGSFGRLPKPAWGSSDPDAEFMRGFGKIQRRTKAGMGLRGEEFYAECNNLLRYQESLRVRPFNGRSEEIVIYPTFRRFYFDGVIAGKIELGFRLDEDIVRHYSDEEFGFTYDPEIIAEQVLSRKIKIKLIDGREFKTSIKYASKFMSEAYIISTTNNREYFNYEIENIFKYVSFMNPFIYIRSSNLTPITFRSDRRAITSPPLPKTDLSRSNRLLQNFNLVVQSSKFGLEDESSQERAIRLVYAQIRMLLTAHAFYIKQFKSGKINREGELRRALDAFVKRFSFGEPREGNLRYSEIENASKSILLGEGIDMDRLLGEIQKTFKESLFQRALRRMIPYLDRKFDVAIEASATAATNHVLNGGLK